MPITALAAVLLSLGTTLAGPVTLYVATNGSDANSGSIEAPFATLEKARDTLRQLKGANPLTDGATVYVRGGTYHRTNTLVLTPADSGVSTEHPSVWRNQPGETPILIGALPVTTWSVHKGQVLVSDVSTQACSIANFTQLFFNGERQRLARFPNYDHEDPYRSGWSYVATPMGSESYTNFTYADGDVRGWANPKEAEVVIHPGENWWNKISRIHSINTNTRAITIAEKDSRLITTNNRYFVQNLLEELDAPGEWYLDRIARLLYFYPSAAISEANPVYSPSLDTFVSFARGTSNVVWRGFTMQFCTNSAVTVTSSTNIIVAGNIIRHVGDYNTHGVEVSGGLANGVVGNDVSHVGYYGIWMTGGRTTDLVSGGHYAENNWIHHPGVYNKKGSGIGLKGVGLRASRNLIHDGPRAGVYFCTGQNYLVESNHIYDVMMETDDGAGIYCYSGQWGADWISDRGTVVRGNYVHDIGGYGFYGVPGSKYSGKYYNPFYACGIYLDGMTSGVDIVGNIFVNASWAGVFINGGRDNRVLNNIIAHCDSHQILLTGYPTNHSFWISSYSQMVAAYNSVAGQPAWAGMRGMDVGPTAVWPQGLTVGGNEFATNVVIYTNLTTALPWESRNYLVYCHRMNAGSNYWDYNTYYHGDVEPRSLCYINDVAVNATWLQWRSTGNDMHSVTNNPLVNSDWTLGAASPATALGFRQIEVGGIGCFQDEYRASWPVPGRESPKGRPAGHSNLRRSSDVAR